MGQHSHALAYGHLRSQGWRSWRVEFFRVAMNDYAALILGVACAGAGGELFVRGAVGLARWARISPGIIGVTVAAFATSSPELSVAINAAIAGKPQISLGDGLGSNVVNVALTLALALVIAEVQSPRDTVHRDLPVALLVPVVTGFLLLDGLLSRFPEGCFQRDVLDPDSG